MGRTSIFTQAGVNKHDGWKPFVMLQCGIPDAELRREKSRLVLEIMPVSGKLAG